MRLHFETYFHKVKISLFGANNPMALFKKKTTPADAPQTIDTTENPVATTEPTAAATPTTEVERTAHRHREYEAVSETVEHIQIQVKQGEQTVNAILVRTKRETIRYTEDVFVHQKISTPQVSANQTPEVVAPEATTEVADTQNKTKLTDKAKNLIPKTKNLIPQSVQKFNPLKELTNDAPEQTKVKQLIGLVMIETVDVFTDELLNLLQKNGISKASDSWTEATKNSASRIQTELAKRFVQRQIMQQAKEYKIEDGIKDLTNVMPSILMKILLRVPAFTFAVIKEASLSMVKCANVLRSDDENKFATIVNILSAATVNVITMYVQTVISTAIGGIPVIGRFSDDIAGVFIHMLKTIVPLLAVYVFEQGKKSIADKLSFGKKSVE